MAETLIEAGGLLRLPRLRVQNANAITGPLSWGFPAPTAFTGFVHALERRLSGRLAEGFGGVGIVCHGFAAQASQPAGRHHQVFHLTRNPVGKDGGAPALIEEARAHLEITLLIAVRDVLDEEDGKALAQAAFAQALGMRLAGGSILPAPPGKRYGPGWHTLPENLQGQREVFLKLRRPLLPGSALVQREDLLRGRLAEMQAEHAATALDALLDLCRLNIEPDPPASEDAETTEWHIHKRRPGWLVPLPVGYAGISELYPPGQVANARDGETPFRFVEALYSLGEWVSPHRIETPGSLLWHTEADTEVGLYRCVNRYADTLPQPTESNQPHKENTHG